jgi:transcriptional regulator with GAF, ATPase, and Fis domain
MQKGFPADLCLISALSARNCCYGTGALVGEPLVLPLVYQKEAIGQLRLAPRTPGEPFSPADRRLLGELARQAGLAAHAVQLTADLQRSYEQLEQRVEERTRELSSLLEISHTVASTLQLKPLLGLILEQLKLVIDYSGAAILAVEGDDLVFLDHRNVAQEHLLPLRFPVKNLGLIWETLRSRKSIIVPALLEETPWPKPSVWPWGSCGKPSFRMCRPGCPFRSCSESRSLVCWC